MCLSTFKQNISAEGLFTHREGADRHNAEDQTRKMGSSNAIRQVSTNAQLPGASNRRLWHKAEAHPNQLIPMVVQLYVDIVLQSSSAGLAIMWLWVS